MDIGSVSTEQLFEQFKATLQLSQSGATAWYDCATLSCAISYNILLHQQDQALRGVSPLVPLDEREHLRTAPFRASSLFDELATKLQLRDKVASQQQDYTLYRGSAPFTVGKTRAAPHRSAPARSAHLRQAAMPIPLSFSRQQSFLATTTQVRTTCIRGLGHRSAISLRDLRPSRNTTTRGRVTSFAYKEGGSSVPVLRCPETKEMQRVGVQCSGSRFQ